MNGADERWLPVPGYPLYQVSSFGRVKSCNLYSHSQPIIMHSWPDKDGHMKVRLSKDGKASNVFVHRLVAIAFIPNPKNLPIVNHLDENPANNRIENLEWCTALENTVYNKMPTRRAAALRRPIIQKDLNGHVVKIWSSRAEIEAKTEYFGGNITLVCQGKRKSAYGFTWEYSEKE